MNDFEENYSRKLQLISQNQCLFFFFLNFKESFISVISLKNISIEKTIVREGYTNFEK